jgi:hypothetical protein
MHHHSHGMPATGAAGISSLLAICSVVVPQLGCLGFGQFDRVTEPRDSYGQLKKRSVEPTFAGSTENAST